MGAPQAEQRKFRKCGRCSISEIIPPSGARLWLSFIVRVKKRLTWDYIARDTESCAILTTSFPSCTWERTFPEAALRLRLSAAEVQIRPHRVSQVKHGSEGKEVSFD